MKVKATDVIGLKVISFDNGEELDKVKDVIYDAQENKVRALLVDSGGWFSDAKVIFMENVKSIGEDAVMIPNKTVIRKASDINQERISSVAKDDKEYLTKTKVISEDGKDLGHITDIFFDSFTGNVEDFEVSNGAFENISSGKKIIKVTDIIKIGKEATIVKSNAVQMIEDQKQNKGATGFINDIKNKAQDFTDKATQKAQDLTDKASQKAQDIKSQVQDENNQQKVKDKLSDIKDNVTSKVSDTADTLKNKADEGKDTLQQKTEEAKQSSQEKSKEELAGKYATTNILSQNDEIILRRGEMVTHETIQKLEKRNLLSKLFGNVSDSPLKLM